MTEVSPFQNIMSPAQVVAAIHCRKVRTGPPVQTDGRCGMTYGAIGGHP